jgi:membrane protease YdiL (CAAX protease family)
VLSFEWATFVFILLNLTLPFWVIQRLQKNVYKPVPFNGISFSTLGEITLLVFFTFPAIQIVGQFLSIFVSNPLQSHAFSMGFPLWFGFVVLAPFIEEYFFRGLLLRAYEEQGIRFGIFWTSLWFGLYHLSIHQGLYTFMFALLLGGVMSRHHNIVVPILVHSGVNALSYGAGLEQSGRIMTIYYELIKLSTWSWGFQGIYIVGFALCIYLIYLKGYIKESLRFPQTFKMDAGTWVVVSLFAWIVIFYGA